MASPLDTDVFSRQLKAARNRASLSQAALAELADVSTETISRLERGAIEASLSTALGIAEALGVTLDYLVGRAKGKRAPASAPTVAKLTARAEQLPTSSQRALLRLAELLPARD